uniref:Uncharacterized protein n=1 Tax=Nelumbo nucifera TaxID=4432 RepID=A0A822Z9Q0_NELNU|nr:TPA_asm: hypothetical protein HUJ06_014488 [Nelumbo nucifera]
MSVSASREGGEEMEVCMWSVLVLTVLVLSSSYQGAYGAIVNKVLHHSMVLVDSHPSTSQAFAYKRLVPTGPNPAESPDHPNIGSDVHHPKTPMASDSRGFAYKRLVPTGPNPAESPDPNIG